MESIIEKPGKKYSITSENSKNTPETIKETSDNDIISNTIGEFGKWQLTLTFLLSLFNLPCTWHIVAMSFQAPPVDFWCAPPDKFDYVQESVWRNISHTPPLEYDTGAKDNPCLIWDVDYSSMTLEELMQADFAHSGVGTRECTKWNFDDPDFPDTVVSEWNLVCDRAYLKDTTEMTFLAGSAIGGLISGMISDRFGRKKTLMICLMLQITIGVSLAFTPWIELFLVLRCFLGFISVSIVFSGFVLCVEIVGGKWRTISGISYLFPVPLGYITIAGIAYYVPEWEYQQLTITLPAVLLVSMWWVLPESPRWLLTMGKTDEVHAILVEAARVNKRKLPHNIDKLLQQEVGVNSADDKKATVFDLFRHRNIRKKSLVLYVIWFSVYFVYYGLVMNLSMIGGNIYINTIISGAVEIPSIAISIFILLKMGRRWPLCLTMVGSGIACLCTLSVPVARPDLEWLTITFAMLGKFMISSSNAVMPVFTAELFPTVVRNLGVGSSNVAAGVSLVLVPYLWNLTVVSQSLPMGLLGASGVIGGLCVLILQETANQPLIDTLEEGEDIDRLQKKKKNAMASENSEGKFNDSFTE